MTTPNPAPADIVLEALAMERGVSRADVLPTPQNLRSGLETLQRLHGGPQAASLVESLLEDDLQTLEWQPAFGLSLIQWALTLAPPSERLLATACTWLSLYYQELDDVIARCRSLLDQRGAPSLAEAGRTLTEALRGLDP
jgi:hypothetical protein